MCKYSNVFSLAVLIGRGLDHNFLVSLQKILVSVSDLYSVLKVHLYLKKAKERIKPKVYCRRLGLCTISSVGRAPDS